MSKWSFLVVVAVVLAGGSVSGWAAAPVADFICTQTGVSADGAVLTFTDRSTNSPTSWSWDFGDGSNATEQNPVHTYATTGVYDVYLTVANADGANTCDGGAEVKSDVSLDFYGTPTSGGTPLTVAFTNTSLIFGFPKHPTDRYTITWEWSFGDGESSTEQNPTHTYAFAGSYTVVVKVICEPVLGQTLSGRLAKPDYVTVTAPAHQLSVSAASSHFTVASHGSTNLTGSAVDSELHGITSWSWSDGGRGGSFSDASAQNPTYTAPSISSPYLAIPLTVTATCAGPSPLTASGVTLVTVMQSSNSYGSGTTQKLSEDDNVQYPEALSVDVADGSCWVTDPVAGQVIHLAANGTEMWRGRLGSSALLAADPADSSFWALYSPPLTSVTILAHVAGDGSIMWGGSLADSGGSASESVLAVNPADGSTWSWFENDPATPLTHRTEDGTELPLNTSYSVPYSLALNPSDGSCWTILESGLTHIGEDGTKLFSLGETKLQVLDTNPADGSVWYTDYNSLTGLHHLASDGSELGTVSLSAFVCPIVVVNPVDGSAWVAEVNTCLGPDEVVHLDKQGNVLWQGKASDFGLAHACAAAVNPADGSCWFGTQAIDTRPNGHTIVSATKVVHLGVPAAPLPTADFSGSPTSGQAPLPVVFAGACSNATSWSWDFGDGSTSTALNPSHAYGGGGFTVRLTAVNAYGSDTASKTNYVQAETFSDVAPSNWAFQSIETCVANGIVEGYSNGTYAPGDIVNPRADGHLHRAGAGRRRQQCPGRSGHRALHRRAHESVGVQICRVRLCARHRAGKRRRDLRPGPEPEPGPDGGVPRGAMVGGDAALADWSGPSFATFPDVPMNFWAWKHVEWIAARSVTKGYGDGYYHPDDLCPRDQMAVFVARAFKLE